MARPAAVPGSSTHVVKGAESNAIGLSLLAAARRNWTRDELLVGLRLYMNVPYGQFNQRTPEIISVADSLGRTPSAVAMKLLNFASIDESLPQLGLSNASAADRSIWAEMQNNWPNIAIEIDEANGRLGIDADHSQTPVAESEPVGRGVDDVAETRIRRGQSQFRAAVLSAYGKRCCITGLNIPRLLIASHIVPWRDDPANRLSPRNGLCLSALHDRAFDQGLISLDSDFRLLISPQVKSHDDPFVVDSLFAYRGKPIRLPDKFAPDPQFLRYHRENIFLH